MKKILLIIIATFFNLLVCHSQEIAASDGYIGIKTQISNDNQYLKIIYCDQGSPAEISGLKVSDRIYYIDGKKVNELEDPILYLHSNAGKWVKLTVNRFGKADLIDINVPRISVALDDYNYVSEGHIKTRIDNDFSRYIVSDRAKAINLTTTWVSSKEQATMVLLSDDTRDMFKYKTYDFELTSVEDPLLEKKLFEELGRQLNTIGMIRSTEKPDILIIMSFYSGQKEQYVPPQQIISTKIKTYYNWYWGFIPMPITQSTTTDGYSIVTYLTNISLKFLDANEIEGSKTPPVVWSGSISQVLNTKTFLIDKCKNYFTRLLYQFPVVWHQNSEYSYLVNYTYTGIIYNLSDIKSIAEVIPGSPADKSDIRKGDIILNINGQEPPAKYNYNDVKDYMLSKNTGFRYLQSYSKPVSIVLKRNGKKQTFSFTGESRIVYLMY
jgi:membrane-associated protease RseP (regulator of RpoE activity)